MEIARNLKSLIFPRNEFVSERTFLHDKIIFFSQDFFNRLDYISSVLEKCFGKVQGVPRPSLKKVWRDQEKVCFFSSNISHLGGL